MFFRDVEFRYARRQEVLALGGVSLALQPGRMVALVGLSGSGKSTLVSLLQRLYDPTGGAVRTLACVLNLSNPMFVSRRGPGGMAGGERVNTLSFVQ